MDKKMHQQVMTAPGEIEFREIAVPQPGPGQVLVKVIRIGICGSDIHVYHGKHPFTSYPVTQGHEVSGEVAALGDGVENLSVGQKVTIEPQVFCGECYPCRHGKYNLCESLKVMGFQTTGAASTYFVLSADKVTVLPDRISFDEGAMIEPLAVAVHANRQCGVSDGHNIAVIGAGPIGILVAQTAQAFGAATVMITDISDFRLAKARACGIGHAYNTEKTDFNDALLNAFGPDKADVIFDCAGQDITISQAIAHARKGSKIILVAVFEDKASVDLAVLNDHEIDLNTSMMYRHEDYVDAIRLVEDGKVRLDPLITKTFAFRDYNKAYRFISENRETCMKILIDVQS